MKRSEFTDAVGSITDPDFVRRQMVGVSAIIHTATLHKPHVATHSKQDFVDTNVTGTLNLLEAAVAAGVKSFVFTSTTSAFGSQLRPEAGQAAVWVTEDLVSCMNLLEARRGIRGVIDIWMHLGGQDSVRRLNLFVRGRRQQA